MKLKQISQLVLLALGAAAAAGSAQATNYVEIDSAQIKFFYDADFWGLGAASVVGNSISFSVDSDYSVSANVKAGKPNGDSTQKYLDSATPGVIAVAQSGYQLQSSVAANAVGNYALSASGGQAVVGASGAVTSGTFSGSSFTAGSLLGFYDASVDRDSNGAISVGLLNSTVNVGDRTPTAGALGVEASLFSFAHQAGPGLTTAALTTVGYGFAVTPVPEPETYAMLLAGLGLVGAIARRRRQKAA